MATPVYVKREISRLPDFIISTSSECNREALQEAQEEFVKCLVNVISPLREKLSVRLEHGDKPGHCVLVLPLLSQWAKFITEAVVRECYTSLTSFLIGEGVTARVVICHEDVIQKKIMEDGMGSLQLDADSDNEVKRIDNNTIDATNDPVGGGLEDREAEENAKEGLVVEDESQVQVVGEKNETETIVLDGKFVGMKILGLPTSDAPEVVRLCQPESDPTWTSLTYLHMLDIYLATGPAIYIMKPDWCTFGVDSDISLRWDSTGLDHALELYGFPAAYNQPDLVKIFKEFEEVGFTINWTDDTHAIIRFASKEIANEAFMTIRHPLLKCRPLSIASRKTKLMLVRSPDRRLPYKRRPQTESQTAKRLILSSLGIRKPPGAGEGQANN